MKTKLPKAPFQIPVGIFYILSATLLFSILVFIALVIQNNDYPFYEKSVSNIGRICKNPTGFWILSLACILSGPLIIWHYKSIVIWRCEDAVCNKAIDWLIPLGYCCGLMMIFIGIFPADYPWLNFPVAIVFFVSELLVMLLSVIILWRHPATYRWIILFSVASIVFHILFLVSLSDYNWAEWLAIYSSFLVGCLVGFNSLHLQNE